MYRVIIIRNGIEDDEIYTFHTKENAELYASYAKEGETRKIEKVSIKLLQYTNNIIKASHRRLF